MAEESNDDLGDVSSLGEESDADDSEINSEDDSQGKEASSRPRIWDLLREEVEDMSVSEQVAYWHNMVLPMEVDLITELDGQSLFFIHAESLIYDLAVGGTIDFLGDPQFLRLTYAIEQVLDRIRAASGRFRLVFFDCCRSLFEKSSCKILWTFRQAFLLHCCSADLDFVVLPDWYSQGFSDHMAQWQPSFMLQSIRRVAVGLSQEDSEEGELWKVCFQSLALRCLGFQTPVALQRSLIFRGNRAMTFSVDPEHYEAFIDRNARAKYKSLFSETRDAMQASEPNAFREDLTTFMENIRTMPRGQDLDATSILRCFVTACFAKELLATAESQGVARSQLEMLVIKVLQLHDLLLRSLPLDRRNPTVVDAKEWGWYSRSVLPKLDTYFSVSSQVLASLATDKVEGFSPEVADFFDARIYRFLFQFVMNNANHDDKEAAVVTRDDFGMPDFALEQLNSLWGWAGGKDDFFPICINSLVSAQSRPPKVLQREVRVEPAREPVKSDYLELLDRLADSNDLGALPSKAGASSSLEIDSVQLAEYTGLSLIEQKMTARFRAKTSNGGINDRDQAFLHKYRMKQRQLAIRSIRRQANSLGCDKLFHPIHPDRKAEDWNDWRPSAWPKGQLQASKASKAPKISSKAKELIENHQAEKASAQLTKDNEKLKYWEPKAEALGGHRDPVKLEKELLERLLGLHRATDSFVDFPAVSAAFETPQIACKFVVKAIKNVIKSMKAIGPDHVKQEEQPVVRNLVCHIFCMVKEAFNSYKEVLDGKAIKTLQEALLAFNFKKTSEALFASWKQVQKRQLQDAKQEEEKNDNKDKKDKKDKDKKDKKNKKDKKDSKEGKEKEEKNDDDLESFAVTKTKDVLWKGVGEDEFGFQLKYLGPQMTRSVGNAPDPLQRVMFKPDKWQRDLLDLVDARKSAVVSAPTASGKTFICYYCMEQVLKHSDSGVCVYVGPSKALVNQVSAEVFARFDSKSYDAAKSANSDLNGVFIKDYNRGGGSFMNGSWRNCQIVLMEPRTFEMVLLSPKMQPWVDRLLWVVFDEVHCIGDEEGSVWERCIQACPCPFLALSATIADPQYFHTWLKKLNGTKQLKDVELIVHTERWNDLYQYIYRNGNLQPLHPFCCLTESVVKKNGLPTDLNLTPVDLLRLFEAVAALSGKDSRWEALRPSTYFGKSHGFLTKKDVQMDYQKDMKECFMELLNHGVLSGDKFVELKQALEKNAASLDPQAAFKPPSRGESMDVEKGTDTMFSLERSDNYRDGMKLLQTCQSLDKAGCLPAIVFNFDRNECTQMCLRLSKALKDMQHDKYYGNAEKAKATKQLMDKRWAKYEADCKKYEQAKQFVEIVDDGAGDRFVKPGEGGGDDLKEPDPPIDVAESLDDEFSFHNVEAMRRRPDYIMDLLNEAKRALGAFRTTPLLWEGLRRGIGVHHEAMGADRHYVEMLFRAGYLKVVFATATLAMGINMPCRTTVFCGHHLELTGLMFRQMSGRAGRRGFDLMGQVVFLDKSFRKISSLLASDCPPLLGQMSLSSSLLLRTLLKWEHLPEDDPKLEAILREQSCLFRLPFFRASSADLEKQVRCHTRCLSRFLYEEGLISMEGNSTGLAQMVCHLQEFEPANFVLARLLKSGALSNYLRCQEYQEVTGYRSDTVRLAGVLGWLLGQRRLPAGSRALPEYMARTRTRKNRLPCETSPILPLPEEEIMDEVLAYNQAVFKLTQDVALTACSSREFTENDFTLPLTGKNFNMKSEAGTVPIAMADSSFGQCLDASLIKCKSKSRSPFAMLSGKGDDSFTSLQDLMTSARRLVYLDMNSFSSAAAPIYADPELVLPPTNSWLLDLMLHRNLLFLTEDNGIKRPAAFKLLMQTIEFIAKVIETRALDGDDFLKRVFGSLKTELEQIRASAIKKVTQMVNEKV